MANEKTLISKIFQKIKRQPKDFQQYSDLFTVCRDIAKSNFNLAHDCNGIHVFRIAN